MADLVKKPLLCHLPVEQLQRGRFQPRRDFDAAALQELAESIRASGLIQPIVVRACGEMRYEIVAGERRWRAAQLAGLPVVPCLIYSYTDEQTATITAIENIQRKDLNPIEEAQALQRLIDDFDYSHDEAAAAIGKSRSHVSNSLRLLRLDERIQAWLIQGRLSEGHGKILAGLNAREQMALAERCVDQAWSVRQTEQALKKMQVESLASVAPRADIKRLERVIADHLGAKVKVDAPVSTQGGWLSIQFHDNDTLAGLLEKIGLKDEL
jgi:ParB family transcriptional regulator, chromosome partitioning protein